MNRFDNIPIIPIERGSDALYIAYQFHKTAVEKEVKRILDWIESRARLGSIETSEVVVLGYERTHFVMNRLLELGFCVEKKEQLKDMFEGYRLDIKWG
jgi:hypothetical protein